MKTIWKYRLPTENEPVLEMPEGAEVINVDVQDATPCLWAIVNPEAAAVSRKFYIRGTGHPLGDAAGKKHLGTFQLHQFAPPLVFHVFDGQ